MAKVIKTAERVIINVSKEEAQSLCFALAETLSDLIEDLTTQEQYMYRKILNEIGDEDG